MSNNETNISVKIYFYKHQSETRGIVKAMASLVFTVLHVCECVYLRKHDRVCLSRC